MPFSFSQKLQDLVSLLWFNRDSNSNSNPTVAELLGNRGSVVQAYRSRSRGFQADPLWNDQDTQLLSLYRMYQYLVVGWTIQLRNEIEYFWNHKGWAVKGIPDPMDNDAERYAILAALPHFLVQAFNRLIDRGLPRYSAAIIENPEELQQQAKILEEVPEWCKNVAPLPSILNLPLANGDIPAELEDPRASDILKRWNILRHDPHVLFVMS
ncbi:hypothetical protein AA313_de0209851 [Arthrobotrys entomopaga]|nr:hypothetical protein AA313_de0209851 [Arthrobotrys entomopaga]